MGIKNFTKVFPPKEEITFKSLKGKWVAIDAMFEIHRASRPFKTQSGFTYLTAPDGRTTNHIQTLLFSLIIKLQNVGANQCWVFDHPINGHNPIKQSELDKRKVCSEKAKKKLQECKELHLAKQNQVISDSDESDCEELKLQIAKYERASFSLEEYFIEDLKFILNCLDIPWIEAPEGYEAEQLAAILTRKRIDGIKVNAVITPDPDTLLFGAEVMIKRDKGKLYQYKLEDLLENYEIELDDLIKIGIILGCDFAEKTKGVGVKTVLNKFEDIELNDEQEDAFDYFTKNIPKKILLKLEWNWNGENSFQNKNNIKKLFNWVVNIKGFNLASTKKKFGKLLID